MPDPSATQGQQLPPEIAEIIRAQVAEQVQSQVTSRIGGFQRLVSERDSQIGDLQTKLRTQHLASLPEDERAAAEQNALSDENARLRAELELNDLFAQYPDEAPVVRNLIKSDSTLAQLQAVREARLAWAPVAPPPAAPPAPGTVDLNRPGSATTPSSFQDGTPMDEPMADALLAGSSRDTLATYTRR